MTDNFILVTVQMRSGVDQPLLQAGDLYTTGGLVNLVSYEKG